MKIIQHTYVNDVEPRKPIERSPERMVELLAQVLVMKECGHDYSFHRLVDDNYNTIGYTVDFTCADGDRVHQHFIVSE